MSRFPQSGRFAGSSLRYHLGALIAVTAWGAAFISTKILLQNGLDAVEIYIYRFFIAYIITFIVCPKPFWSNSVRHELLFILCGMCGGSIYFVAENLACSYTLVSNVSLIVTLTPLITTLISTMLYRNERLGRGVIAGSIVALLGVACVIFNSSLVVKIKPIGDLLALLAAITFAIYTLVLRNLNPFYSTWFISRKTFFYGVVTALPFLAFEPSLCPLSVLTRPQVLINLGFLSLVASMLAFVLWAQTVKRLGLIKSGNYLYFSPIVTLILSSIMLGEHISWVGYIGCSLILGGVIMSDKFSGNPHTPNHQA